MTEEQQAPTPETTFRFVAGLGPTGPDHAIEYIIGYRIESATEIEYGNPKILETQIMFQHLTKEHLEGLRDQINGAIGLEP